VAQLNPRPAFDQHLVDRAIAWLHTRDPRLFPFTERFDDERERAFARDLRVSLNDLTESGSKRGTSAAGFLVSDDRLQGVIEAWEVANGDWPAGADPDDPTKLVASLKDPATGQYDRSVPTQSDRSAI
jgi:hypothetical protein